MLGAAEEPMPNNLPISYDLCGQVSKFHLYFKSLTQCLKNRFLFVKSTISIGAFNKEKAHLRTL